MHILLELARDAAHQVHHVAVALHRAEGGYLDRSVGRDAAHVIAAQIHQHHMLGAFLGVRQ